MFFQIWSGVVQIWFFFFLARFRSSLSLAPFVFPAALLRTCGGAPSDLVHILRWFDTDSSSPAWLSFVVSGELCRSVFFVLLRSSLVAVILLRCALRRRVLALGSSSTACLQDPYLRHGLGPNMLHLHFLIRSGLFPCLPVSSWIWFAFSGAGLWSLFQIDFASYLSDVNCCSVMLLFKIHVSCLMLLVPYFLS